MTSAITYRPTPILPTQVSVSELHEQNIQDGAERKADGMDMALSAFIFGGDPRKTDFRRGLEDGLGYYEIPKKAGDLKKALSKKKLISTAGAIAGYAGGALAAAGLVVGTLTGALPAAALLLGGVAAVGVAGAGYEAHNNASKFDELLTKTETLMNRAADRLNSPEPKTLNANGPIAVLDEPAQMSFAW